MSKKTQLLASIGVMAIVIFVGGIFTKNYSSQSAATIASQKAISPTPPAQCVYVVGYNTPGNGTPPPRSIKKFTLSGTLITQWNIPYYYPTDIAVSLTGNVYVTASTNFSPPLTGTVAEYNPSGMYINSWMTGTLNPEGIAISSSNNVYVTGHVGTNPTNGLINEYSSSGALIASWPQTYWPLHLAFDASGTLYTGDVGSPLVHEFTSSGVPVATFTIPGVTFNQKFGVSSSGNIYIPQGMFGTTGNNWINEYSSSGASITQWIVGGTPLPNGRAESTAVSSSGNVYTIHNMYYNGKITVHEYSPSGTLITQWGGFKDNSTNYIAVGSCGKA